MLDVGDQLAAELDQNVGADLQLGFLIGRLSHQLNSTTVVVSVVIITP